MYLIFIKLPKNPDPNVTMSRSHDVHNASNSVTSSFFSLNISLIMSPVPQLIFRNTPSDTEARRCGSCRQRTILTADDPRKTCPKCRERAQRRTKQKKKTAKNAELLTDGNLEEENAKKLNLEDMTGKRKAVVENDESDVAQMKKRFKRIFEETKGNASTATTMTTSLVVS